MKTMLTRLAALLFLVSGLLLVTVAGVEAQEDKWSFFFTPQVWFENIRNSGFSAATSTGGAAINAANLQLYGIIPTSTLKTNGSDPTSTFFPQWGGQFAAQYGRWTFGAAAQYVSYETTQDFFIQSTTQFVTGSCSAGFVVQSIPPFGVVPTFFPACPGTTGFNTALDGQKLFTEKISTDRVDTDITATYFFPDVIKDVLDVTTGLGFKWIRASGQRTLINNGAHLFQAGGLGVPSVNYILKSCGNQTSFASSMNSNFPVGPFDPGNCQRNQASFLDQQYGATIPTTLNFHAGRESKWLVPVTMVPFLGSEVSTDQILGAQNSFAYGGTFDAGVRYVFSNGIAVYGGWRGQVFQGNNLFFSQGPLFNISVALGGR